METESESLEVILERIRVEASQWLVSRKDRPELITLLNQVQEVNLRHEIAAVIEAVVPQCKTTQEAYARLGRAFGLTPIFEKDQPSVREQVVNAIVVGVLTVVVLSVGAAVFSSMLSLVR